jgi:hypothetical protein
MCHSAQFLISAIAADKATPNPIWWPISLVPWIFLRCHYDPLSGRQNLKLKLLKWSQAVAIAKLYLKRHRFCGADPKSVHNAI